jgi:hypothetical protein
MQHERKLGEIGGCDACRATAYLAPRPLCGDRRRDDSSRNVWRACQTIASVRGFCAPTHYVGRAVKKPCGSELNPSRAQPRDLRHKNRRDEPSFFAVSSAQAFGVGSATTALFMPSSAFSASCVPLGAASPFLHIRRLLSVVGAPEVSPARKGWESPKKGPREASFCAVSSAQAFEVDSEAPALFTDHSNSSARAVQPLPITNHNSLIIAFLIDTLAIRIGPKSFNYTASLHSNRHSSGAWKLHQNCADSPSRGRQCFLGWPGTSPSPTPDLGAWSRANFQPSSGLAA